MTQDSTHSGELSSDKVAELEKKLADAAAEVARVQAQLTQAQQAGAPPPPTGVPLSTTPPPAPGVPGTTVPPVPYGGGMPQITINGQPVVPGSGNFLQSLQQLKAAHAAGMAPIVLVNGQQVSGGQPVDLSAYITPQVTQQLHDALGQLGLDSSMGTLFGHPPVPLAPAPSPTSVAPLTDPPRHVPFTFRLATFDLSVWELFILFVGAVAGGFFWITVDYAAPIALIAAVVAIGFFRVRKYHRRIGMLKWGKVATVTNSDEISRGTYYSGTTYQNMYLRQAQGWDVTSRLYSGPASVTTVNYTLDGYNGSLEVKGLPYTNGVVLADSRKPSKAMVVSQFPYSVKPDESGRFVGTLSAWRWGGVIATLVVELTLVYVAVVAAMHTWF